MMAMKPINHAQAHTLIQAQADGLLTPSQEHSLQAHLENCLECQVYAAEIQALQVTLVHSLQNHWGEPQLPPQAVDRMVQGVRHGLAPRPGGLMGGVGKLLLGLAGLAVLGIMMWGLILGIGSIRVQSRLHNGSPSVSPTALASTSTATLEVQVPVQDSTATASPTVTPMATLTATPGQTVCQVEAVKNLFCRAGPGSVYKDLDSFTPGQMAPIIGQSLDGQYWYVTGPNLGKACTVPTGPSFVIVHGENCIAPRFTPGPTPHPTEAPEHHPQCADGVDNDGDGRVDFSAAGAGDRECTSADDNDEAHR
jgi:hypothetical protein